MGPRRGLPGEPDARPPARRERVLLRARRGLQSPRRTLPLYVAARALGPQEGAEVKPDGFGRYLHPGGACEFYLEYDRGTEAFGALSRKLEGYLRLAAGWTEDQDLSGFPNLLLVVPRGCARGRSARPFVMRSGAFTSVRRSRRRSHCTWRARIVSESAASSGQRGGTWLRTASESRLSTFLPGRATSIGAPGVSAGTGRTTMSACGVGSLPPPLLRGSRSSLKEGTGPRRGAGDRPRAT